MSDPNDLLLAEYYDSIYSYGDKRLVLESLNRCRGPLVDLGCATGRVLRFALENGFQAIGIDHSPEMLRIAAKRMKPLYGQNFRVVRGNFVDLPIREEVGVITCMANTYSMILAKSDRKALLNNVNARLRKDGCFILWIMNDRGVNERFFAKEVCSGSDVMKFYLDWSEDELQRTRTFIMKLTQGNREENHIFPTRLLSTKEMRNEISEAGLVIKGLFGDLDGGPYTDTSQKQVYYIERQ